MNYRKVQRALGGIWGCTHSGYYRGIWRGAWAFVDYDKLHISAYGDSEEDAIESVCSKIKKRLWKTIFRLEKNGS